MSTYTPIASTTLSSGQASVTFDSIPQTYTDLVLVSSVIHGSAFTLYMRFSGDSATNYSSQYMSAYSTSVQTSRFNNDSKMLIGGASIGMSSTDYATAVTHIQNYSNTVTYKSILSKYGLANAEVNLSCSTWRSISPVTSLTIIPSSGNLLAGCTFTVYGIESQSTPQAKATGGQSIYTDGTYWYHIFTQSGTFTPSQALTVDYLVVAGGGGGGGDAAGGGGAGGYRTSIGGSTLSCLAQTYPIIIGAGGAGTLSNSTGTRGNNSSFFSITSTGGGGGKSGAAGSSQIATGGSGGGGHGEGVSSGYSSGGAGNQGGYSPVEGFAGGNGAQSGGAGPAGGGGGSSAVGQNAPGTGAGGTAGNGGAGTANSITGTSITYAGGGGGGGRNAGTGGTGGTGGGGNGGANAGTVATSGTANTGGGGGGGGTTGAAGGSGIVVIRYAA